MTTFFDQHKKVILKWITNCEKKEKQVKSDVTDLRGSRDGYVKIKVRLKTDKYHTHTHTHTLPIFPQLKIGNVVKVNVAN